MVLLHSTQGPPELKIRKLFNDISSWTTRPNLKLFRIIVPHDAIYQNCTNGSAPPNEGAARALDRKCLLTTFPPEPLVQIQNNFTGLCFIMPLTKIALMVLLHWTKGLPELQIRNIFKRHFLLNHWYKFKIISLNCSSRCLLPKIAQIVPLHWTKGLSEL